MGQHILRVCHIKGNVANTETLQSCRTWRRWRIQDAENETQLFYFCHSRVSVKATVSKNTPSLLTQGSLQFMSDVLYKGAQCGFDAVCHVSPQVNCICCLFRCIWSLIHFCINTRSCNTNLQDQGTAWLNYGNLTPQHTHSAWTQSQLQGVTASVENLSADCTFLFLFLFVSHNCI